MSLHKTFISILQLIVPILSVALFLYVSWWCIFSSHDAASKRFLWWAATSFANFSFTFFMLIMLEDF